MRRLSRTEDPTGCLNLFRYEAATRFGDPSGNIRTRGQYEHHAKRGPGRRAFATGWPCLHGGKWVGRNVMRRGR